MARLFPIYIRKDDMHHVLYQCRYNNGAAVTVVLKSLSQNGDLIYKTSSWVEATTVNSEIDTLGGWGDEWQS